MTKLEVVPIGDGTDYRLRALEQVASTMCRTGRRPTRRCARSFERLAEAHDEDPVLHIEAREITARRRAGGVVWFDFKTLCGGPRSQNDYLEIATQCSTPCCSAMCRSMPQRMASEARRFTWLVDVLYDRRVKLILSAAVAPERLYTEGPLAHEFVRTVSRLHEMQTARPYMEQERRMVDTALT
jgi:cell division protein ZapE